MIFITLMTIMSDTAEAKYKYDKKLSEAEQGATGTSTGRRTPRSPRFLIALSELPRVGRN